MKWNGMAYFIVYQPYIYLKIFHLCHAQAHIIKIPISIQFNGGKMVVSFIHSFIHYYYYYKSSWIQSFHKSAHFMHN